MAKGVSKELKREIRSVLGDLLNGEPGGMISVHLNINPLTRDAINYLDDIRAFENIGTGTYRVAAFGREYWERINTPMPLFWFKQNWFPATVAFMTILASVTGAIANFVS